jgi:uncharacterized protein YgfB (UPF0149 family)
MTEKRFRLELTLKAEVDIDVVGKEDYGYERCIKQFLNEFVKHPDAVLAYYKQLLLYMVIEDSNKKTICRILNTNEDDRHFLDVAASCPEDIKHFIHDLYSHNPSKKLDTGIIEKLRNNIEERLDNLLVTGAQFTLLNPENENSKETQNSIREGQNHFSRNSGHQDN